MENPCEKCLVKTNCTQVCPEKINHMALIKNALVYFRSYIGRKLNQKERKHYIKYDKLLREGEDEVLKIERRKRKISNS
ncbi:MAG: hypothetical protein ACTSWK_04130 [Promethearchaeota archaeon]